MLGNIAKVRPKNPYHRWPHPPLVDAGDLHEQRHRDGNRRVLNHMATATTSMSPATAELFARYVVPNYTRFPVALVRGEGSYVWDDQGRRYLDFFPGWGCNLLGHCPPRVVEAIQQQAAELIHVPNTWHTEAQGRWAQLLSERSFGGKAFFCNSGAEANEAAIKLARLHATDGRYKIITFRGGFHGRTYGATSATVPPKYHEGIGTLLGGFSYAN